MTSPWQPIETAPRDVFVWVFAPGAAFDLPDILCLCRWHEDAGFCVDELREPVLWKPVDKPEPPRQPGETIARAAIVFQGDPWSVSRPGRHHDVIRKLFMAHSDVAPFTGEQGFLTCSGRFVDRREGLAIATAAGQIVRKHGNPTQLFSEDMW